MTPDDLVRAFGVSVDKRQAALMVGAGLSLGAGFPLWKGLVEGVALQVGIPVMNDYPLWAQYIENAPGGSTILLDEVVKQIASVQLEPLENHHLLANLPVGDVWTTNYDALIESAAPNCDVIHQDGDLSALQPADGRWVYKMHGSIPYQAKAPVGGRGQLVITRNDYERYAEETHPRLWRLLQAQFLTKSFLFLGFSFDDPNFGEVLKMVRRAIATGPLTNHFVLMKRPEQDAGLFEAKMGDLELQSVHVVEISDYDEITSILRRLVARTRPMRLLVSGSARNPGQPSWSSGTYPTAPTPDDLGVLGTSLGKALAAANVPGLLAAGEIGALVGYSYIEALGAYDPSRFILLRRRDSTQDLTPPNRRLGEIRFADTEPSDLRDSAFASVRCVVVIGGGKGTLDEVGRARTQGMAVVPIARSGGAAQQIWAEMRKDLPSHEIGQQPIPVDLFEQLAADQPTAVAAAVKLVAQGLFMA